MTESAPTLRRFELTLRKPWLGFYPKPTVVIDGVAQPTQWGTRNWKVRDEVEVSIFIHNRLWTFGRANFTVDPRATTALIYSAPWLPFLPGRIEVSA
ncbi:hypothetical protein ACX80D_01140 [Arthrobacter sp. Sr24]